MPAYCYDPRAEPDDYWRKPCNWVEDPDEEWPPCSWVEDDRDIYCSYCGAKWEWQCAPEKRR